MKKGDRGENKREGVKEGAYLNFQIITRALLCCILLQFMHVKCGQYQSM